MNLFLDRVGWDGARENLQIEENSDRDGSNSCGARRRRRGAR